MESDRRRREEASCFRSLSLPGSKSQQGQQKCTISFKPFLKKMKLLLSEQLFRNATFIHKVVRFRQSQPQDDKITQAF